MKLALAGVAVVLIVFGAWSALVSAWLNRYDPANFYE